MQVQPGDAVVQVAGERAFCFGDASENDLCIAVGSQRILLGASSDLAPDNTSNTLSTLIVAPEGVSVRGSVLTSGSMNVSGDMVVDSTLQVSGSIDTLDMSTNALRLQRATTTTRTMTGTTNRSLAPTWRADTSGIVVTAAWADGSQARSEGMEAVGCAVTLEYSAIDEVTCRLSTFGRAADGVIVRVSDDGRACEVQTAGVLPCWCVAAELGDDVSAAAAGVLLTPSAACPGALTKYSTESASTMAFARTLQPLLPTISDAQHPAPVQPAVVLLMCKLL